jgi:tRNA (guanine-N7-)-methyltransferase
MTSTGEIMNEKPPKVMTSLRSYARVHGRMTLAQQKALTESEGNQDLLLNKNKPVADWKDVFANTQPVVCDVGFGMGQQLYEWAILHPQVNFVGVEIYRPGVACLLRQLQQQKITNVRLVAADIFTLFMQFFPPKGFTTVTTMFPDPWPKQRHQKRRLCLQSSFVAGIRKVLQDNGVWYVSTDIESYAQDIQHYLDQEKEFATIEKHPFLDAYGTRPPSKYEQFGLNRGHKIFDLFYKKQE